MDHGAAIVVEEWLARWLRWYSLDAVGSFDVDVEVGEDEESFGALMKGSLEVFDLSCYAKPVNSIDCFLT